jgi:hypothetical protein
LARVAVLMASSYCGLTLSGNCQPAAKYKIVLRPWAPSSARATASSASIVSRSLAICSADESPAADRPVVSVSKGDTAPSLDVLPNVAASTPLRTATRSFVSGTSNRLRSPLKTANRVAFEELRATKSSAPWRAS